MHDNVKVIIAKYKEDTSWTNDLGYECLIYDKSDNTLPNAIALPNVGREAHTYFTHIVNEYDNLSDMNIFLQGDPFDHLDDRGRTTVDSLRTTLEDIVERHVPFKGLAWFKLKCDELGQPHDLRKPENEGRWPGWGKDIPLGEVFRKLFDAEPPAQIIARAPTGNFCVTGERIRTRPKEFYEYALRLVTDDPRDENNTGHAIERLWQHIFNGNTAWNKLEYK